MKKIENGMVIMSVDEYNVEQQNHITAWHVYGL